MHKAATEWGISSMRKHAVSVTGTLPLSVRDFLIETKAGYPRNRDRSKKIPPSSKKHKYAIQKERLKPLSSLGLSRFYFRT